MTSGLVSPGTLVLGDLLNLFCCGWLLTCWKWALPFAVGCRWNDPAWHLERITNPIMMVITVKIDKMAQTIHRTGTPLELPPDPLCWSVVATRPRSPSAASGSTCLAALFNVKPRITNPLLWPWKEKRIFSILNDIFAPFDEKNGPTVYSAMKLRINHQKLMSFSLVIGAKVWLPPPPQKKGQHLLRKIKIDVEFDSRF